MRRYLNKMTPTLEAKVLKLKDEGLSHTIVAMRLGIGKSTVNKVLARYGKTIRRD